MNRFITITTSALALSLLSSCGDVPDVGIIGGADGPTKIYISDSKDNNDKNKDNANDKSDAPVNSEENQNDK